MQRNTSSFHVDDIKTFKQQMLNWANRFGICCFMDSHDYDDKYHRYDCLVAAGCHINFSPSENIFKHLEEFTTNHHDWIFGHLGYDLKNEIEELSSSNQNKIGFPDVFFFIPKIVLALKDKDLIIYAIGDDPSEIFNQISTAEKRADEKQSSIKKHLQLKASLTKDEYLSTVKTLKEHIHYGDCYEINYCQEFFCDEVAIDPLITYNHLLDISPTPFSCFYKLEKKYLLCASPERYLSKTGSHIYSQPIKGTAPRKPDHSLDETEKENLQKNIKEKTENVMIVDLVRNDLSKICKQGSVKPEELFGIYSFPQVHQMISTIKGELKAGVSFADIIKATFPMGSMTGAPKLSVMKLIEKYEKTKRGLFSGSVGYIDPQQNFDFNVVIRSIFYNSGNSYLNYLVGSAITYYADEEKEYEECLLKAKAIRAALE